MEDIGLTDLIPNEVTEDGDLRDVEPSEGEPGRAGGPVHGMPTQAPVGDVWNVDKQGRQYVGAQGRKGIIYRRDGETVTEALKRDQQRGRDQKPKKKGKTPAPPADVDLKELEKLLADALASPAYACAMAGDEWAADHFTTQGPMLARNLVAAAEHNPWLRKKLEAAMAGGDLGMQLVVMLGLSGSLLGYAAPPIIYWFNVPVPDRARQMFNIPPRRRPDQHADTGPTAQAPYSAAA
jgi:hypothetical protein